MKKIYFLLIFTLVGCSPTKNVISPIKYKEDINVHIPKVAYIYWTPGKRVGSEVTQRFSSGSYGTLQNGSGGVGELLGSVIVAAIIQQHQKNNPSQYVNEYGKADQAVFITSLRDTLVHNNVFKKVELTSDLRKVSDKDVLISVYFKTARVTNSSNVTLTVNLLLKTAGKALCDKTYLVQNDPLKLKGFLEKKTDASQKLLTEIIEAIKQWVGGK